MFYICCYKQLRIMERNIGKDDETLKFLNDLQQLDKDEIIECLVNYFTTKIRSKW